MKKIMFALGVIGLSVAAVAAVNDTLLMFSTLSSDPDTYDTYMDGEKVLDGECYALCYVTDADAFKIKADGTADGGGEVLLTAPVAKDGHCPNLLYVVDAAKAETLKGGAYAVYLLDTRVKDAAGNTVVAGVENGKAKVVNRFGKVVEGEKAVAEDSEKKATDTIAQLPAAPANGSQVQDLSVIDNPTITAIKVDGANIKLTVADLSPAADYKVLTGTDVANPNLFTEVPATIDGSTFTVSKDAGKFFKVKGMRREFKK